MLASLNRKQPLDVVEVPVRTQLVALGGAGALSIVISTIVEGLKLPSGPDPCSRGDWIGRMGRFGRTPIVPGYPEISIMDGDRLVRGLSRVGLP